MNKPNNAITLSTGSKHRNALKALKDSKNSAYPETKEYFESFINELKKFRFGANFDFESDKVVENFESFIPYRNECLDVIRAIAIYSEGEKFGELICTFFEKFQAYFYPVDGAVYSNDKRFSNFKFFAHELFLHCGAILIAEKRYEFFDLLVDHPYYLKPEIVGILETTGTFKAFDLTCNLLWNRNQNAAPKLALSTSEIILSQTADSKNDPLENRSS